MTNELFAGLDMLIFYKFELLALLTTLVFLLGVEVWRIPKGRNLIREIGDAATRKNVFASRLPRHANWNVAGFGMQVWYALARRYPEPSEPERRASFGLHARGKRELSQSQFDDQTNPKKSRFTKPTIISEDAILVGNLHSDSEIEIGGAVTGNIISRNVVVGEHAVVRGEILAEVAVIHGRVDGTVRAKRVKLMATSYVVGDISHEDLSIQTGAFLEGHCKRMTISDGIDERLDELQLKSLNEVVEELKENSKLTA